MGSSAHASRSSERPRRRGLPARALAASSVLALGLLVLACEDVLDDPTFRLWCGDSLCAWKLEAGSVRRAPTWHADDYGVELVDTPTVLSQEVSKSPKCLEFTMVADVDPSAQVSVGVDFNKDGTIDFEQPIPAAKWRPVKSLVTAPARYDGIRFVIKKSGTGRAVLAQLRVQSSNDCKAPAVVLSELPLGTLCGAGADCRSGVCCDGLCSECCSPPGPIGQTLPDGGSTPAPDVTCASGKCEQREGIPNVRVFFIPAVPRQCDPGKRDKPAGAECIANDDCASDACDGVVVKSEKPPPGFGNDAGVPEACEAVLPDAGGDRCTVRAVRGGRCR